MVRTSDFQFENAGSIPANPKIKKKNIFNQIIIKKNINNTIKKKLTFNFFFISLIPPFFNTNLRFIYNSNYEKKILIKQSYIILTWFYYLNFVNKNLNNKNKIKIQVLPLKEKKFTLTKAPMAHKNWSKEQYSFKYYKYCVFFKNNLIEEKGIENLNSSLYFTILTKKSLPNLETNLFFLKKINFYFFSQDFNYFNYFIFLKFFK